MRCTSCYLLVAALLLAALLTGNPLPRRAVVVDAARSVPARVAAPAFVPECPDPGLAAQVVRHEVRDGRQIWWLADGGAVVVHEGRAQRLAPGLDPLAAAAHLATADPQAAAPAAVAVPAAATPAAAAAEPGHDPR